MVYQQQNLQTLTDLARHHSIHSQMVKIAVFAILLFVACLNQAYAEGSRIVKWKDDKGVTHYGDKIPAQYANTENSLINKQGITVKRNKAINYQDQTQEALEAAQSKHDYALLSAFTHESEIDLARDRNLQLDLVAVEGLQLLKENSAKRLADMQKYANHSKKSNKPVPADLTRDIAANQAEIAKIEGQIAERKLAMEATRKRFHNDKQRYIALKSYANGTGPKPEALLIKAP